MVLQWPAPGVQNPGAPREGRPEAPRGGGQPLAGHGSRRQPSVGGEALRRAEQGTPGRRDGAGEEAVRPGQVLVQGLLEPLRGCMLWALGTVAVATGMLDAVGAPHQGIRMKR